MPELLDLLTDQYKTVDAARGVARRAALREKLIAFSEPILTCWLNVLDQARLQNKVNRLVDVACQDYPETAEDLCAAVREYFDQNQDMAPIRDAKRGFLALAELIRQQPGVRDGVVRFQ